MNQVIGCIKWLVTQSFAENGASCAVAEPERRRLQRAAPYHSSFAWPQVRQSKDRAAAGLATFRSQLREKTVPLPNPARSIAMALLPELRAWRAGNTAQPMWPPGRCAGSRDKC